MCHAARHYIVARLTANCRRPPIWAILYPKRLKHEGDGSLQSSIVDLASAKAERASCQCPTRSQLVSESENDVGTEFPIDQRPQRVGSHRIAKLRLKIAAKKNDWKWQQVRNFCFNDQKKKKLTGAQNYDNRGKSETSIKVNVRLVASLQGDYPQLCNSID